MTSVGIMASGVGTTFVVPTTSLQLWLDADDATTFSFGTGTAVATWGDKSPLARSAPTQVTAANRPTRDGTQNGRTTVVFDGVNDKLQAPSWAMTKPVTVFVVARNTAAGSGQRRVFTTHTDGTIRRETNDNMSLWQGASLSAATTWGTTAFHQVTAVFNGSSSKVAVDGGADTTGNAGATAFASGGFTAIGSYTNSTEFWQGDIAEIIMYQREVASSERAAIQSYLKSKWGTP